MALTFTNLSVDPNPGSGSQLISSSITPAANQLVFVTINARNGSSNADPGDPTSVTGNGITYEKVASLLLGTRIRLCLYRGMSASPSAGAVTATFTPATMGGGMVIDQSSADVDTSGSNGAGAIVQAVTGSGSGTSGSVALAAFGAALNAAFGAFAHRAAEGTTPGAGFTELGDIVATVANTLATEYAEGDFDPSASWATSTEWAGIAVEVKAGGGGTPPPSTLAERQVLHRGVARGVARGAR